MPYATFDDLLQAATGGWVDLAHRASPNNALVDGDLLAATVYGTDRSAWSAPAQAAADAAVLRLNSVLQQASSHADTYMFPRYRSQMPLPPELVAGSSLPAVVAAIAYKRLFGAEVPEDVRKGCQWAEDYLRDVSKGIVSLGAVDVSVALPAGRVISRIPTKTFDWGRY